MELPKEQTIARSSGEECQIGTPRLNRIAVELVVSWTTKDVRHALLRLEGDIEAVAAALEGDTP